MPRLFEKVSYESFKKELIEYPDEIVKRIYDSIKLPVRKTKYSAGYDIASPIDIVLGPNESFVIPTGIKAQMNDNEFLALFVRSSLGIKRNIILKNIVGIIDKDYYNNPSNEGHILVVIKNIGNVEVSISSNEAIVQGIFLPYLLTDDDAVSALRTGGIGSTSNSLHLEKTLVKDAKEMLQIQKECFKKYTIKYGNFDTNPYNMTLHRMEFNIKYRLGDYQKIMLNDKIIGGIFGFVMEDEISWQIAQFYILPDYESKGYGTKAINKFLELHKDIKTWYADTIMQENMNMEFYKKIGFEILDLEEEHDGLTFVTMVLTVGNND